MSTMAARRRQVEKMFVVIDPKRLVQPALEKAEWIAAQNGASLLLHCCLEVAEDEPNGKARDVLIQRAADWVERLAELPRRRGLEVTVEVTTSPDWRKAIVEAAARSDADLIVKTSSPHGVLRRRLMETSDWLLLRNSAQPVLLVNSIRISVPRIVLAAVKLKPGEGVHSKLNERIIDVSHQIAESLGAELHVVTVYKGEEIYFDRQRFADACRLPRNRVHATEGQSYRGIAEVAEKIGAGLLIVGCARNPSAGRVIGATAERVIDEVQSDVVVLPAA